MPVVGWLARCGWLPHGGCARTTEDHIHTKPANICVRTSPTFFCWNTGKAFSPAKQAHAGQSQTPQAVSRSGAGCRRVRAQGSAHSVPRPRTSKKIMSSTTEAVAPSAICTIVSCTPAMPAAAQVRPTASAAASGCPQFGCTTSARHRHWPALAARWHHDQHASAVHAGLSPVASTATTSRRRLGSVRSLIPVHPLRLLQKLISRRHRSQDGQG